MVKPSALKIKNQNVSRTQNEEYNRILKYLAETLDDNGLTPA
jgi:hypothetical protein